METYHKINAPFKRYLEGRYKGRLILNDWAVPELEYLAKNKWEFTEKVDGTNIRIRYDGVPTADLTGPWHKPVEFGGRTDNAVIPTPLLEWMQGYFTSDLFDQAELANITLFGEGYGPKIQNGGNYRSDQSFVLFDCKIGDFWLDRDNVNDIANKLGIDSVPVLGVGTLYDAIDIVTIGLGPGPDGRTKSFTGSLKRGLQSAWGEFEAEGIVARPVVPLFNRKGERIVCKIKGKDFK